MFGTPSIGIFALATDEIAIVPKQIPPHRAERIGEWLNVEVVRTNIGGSVLIGSLVCANTNGIVLPHYVREEEIKAIKDVVDANITIMETKVTAFGNLVLANDKGAIANPKLKKRTINRLSDTLGVEVVQSTIASLPYVGSLATATNKGVLAHPMLQEDEMAVIKDVLKVPVEIGTVNSGVPYVSTGLIANSRSAVVGYATTGRELAIIGRCLDVM